MASTILSLALTQYSCCSTNKINVYISTEDMDVWYNNIFFYSDFIYPGKGFGFRQFTIPSQPLIVTLARVFFRVTDS